MQHLAYPELRALSQTKRCNIAHHTTPTQLLNHLWADIMHARNTVHRCRPYNTNPPVGKYGASSGSCRACANRYTQRSHAEALLPSSRPLMEAASPKDPELSSQPMYAWTAWEGKQGHKHTNTHRQQKWVAKEAWLLASQQRYMQVQYTGSSCSFIGVELLV